MWRLFALLSLGTFFIKPSNSTPQLYESPSSNWTTTVYVLDKEALPLLIKEIELLNASNEILKQRLDLMRSSLESQKELLKEIKEKDVCSLARSDKTLSNEKQQTEVNSGYTTGKYPKNCAEAAAATRRSGIYTIQVELFNPTPFLVSCNEIAQDGGWTVIQRRQDGSVDFFRGWVDYKLGFGNLDGEFFIGLDILHAMTTQEPQELLIVMTDFQNVTKFAKYDRFAIGNESEEYAMNVLGTYSGDANDSLTLYHSGQKFTTKDRKNDINGSNCALLYKGGWWYKNCHASNLNGLYLKGEYGKDKYAQGVDWSSWHGHYYSLKHVEMMIRPKRS